MIIVKKNCKILTNLFIKFNTRDAYSHSSFMTHYYYYIWIVEFLIKYENPLKRKIDEEEKKNDCIKLLSTALHANLTFLRRDETRPLLRRKERSLISASPRTFVSSWCAAWIAAGGCRRGHVQWLNINISLLLS